MRVLVHAVFAAVLIGSLLSRERSAEAPVDDSGLEAAVLGVARSEGLRFLAYGANDTGFGRAMAFSAPGCSRPVLATWRPATFEDEAAAVSVPQEGYRRNYVYFDREWDRPDRWAVSMQRIKYGLLAMFGRTDYATSDLILQIDAPRDCPAAQSMDWRPAWSRTDRK
jgi:hypothetical protein